MKLRWLLLPLIYQTVLADTIPGAGPVALDPLHSNDGSAVEVPLPDDTATIDVDGAPVLQKMPELLHDNRAEYPRFLSQRGVEGTVFMHLLVSETGNVDSCAIVRGVHPVLDSNAVRAARRLTFRPGIADNQPVAVVIEYFYRFNICDIPVADSAITFEGYLRECGSRMPIAEASVSVICRDVVDTTLTIPFDRHIARIGTIQGQYCEDGALITTTDTTGYFRFKGLPSCSLTFVAVAPSYRVYRATAFQKKSDRLSVIWYMMPGQTTDYEVVVYGNHEKRTISPITVNQRQIRSIAGAGGDAVKVISSLPGVARSNYIGGTFSIRGTGAYDTKAYLDGLLYYIPFHMGTYKSSYNSDAVESVQLYAGGVSARYGDLIGGVLEMQPRNGRTDRWGGYVDVNLIDATALAEGPLGNKFSIIGSVRGSYLHKLFGVAYDRFGDRLPLQLTPHYRDGILRITGKPHPNHSMHFTFGAFHDEVKLMYPTIRGGNQSFKEQTDRSDAMWEWLTSNLGWEWHINPAIKNTLRIGYNTEHDNFSLFGYFNWKDTEGGLFYRDELNIALTPRCEALIGVEGTIYDYNGDVVIPQTDNSILGRSIAEQISIVMPYYEMQWNPMERLSFSTGLRYNFWGFENHHGSKFPELKNYRGFDNTITVSADPCIRISGKFDLTDRQKVTLAGGNFVQIPPWDKHNDVAGNPDLTTEKSSQCIAGHEWRITDLFSTKLQVYTTSMWDLARMASPYDSVNCLDDGKGRVKGLEVLIRHEPGKHFFGWVSYSLSKSERWDYALDRFIPFESDQTHNVIIVADWRLRKEWGAGLRMQYTTGNPTSPVIGSIYNEHSHAYEQTLGDKNSERLPAHFQIDLKISKTFRMNTWLLSTYLEVFNASYPIYQSPQEYIYNYDPYDYLRRQPDRQIASQVIIPSLGVRAEF